uniref:SusC/RagA family TonB-linked outer membrane protein n=1 Tax=Flavobacterium sp. TaxID=239 RepID=UPI004049D776
MTLEKKVILILGLLFSGISIAQEIKGVVRDNNGPIPDALVVVLKDNTNTVTDFDGNFVIKAEINDEIQISMLGYEKTTVKATENMVVVLKESADNMLNNVVVIGYGTKKQGAVTGSVVQIKSADIIKSPAQSAIQAIQGKAAGVNIVTNDEPGANPSIRIRGLGTLLGSRDPLYVIDGVEAGSLNGLSPNEIETMDILKDASSLAIYGQKGANGVVIITTKKGKNGKMKVSYNSYFGIKQIQREVELGDAFFYSYYNNTALGSATYFANNQPYNTNWLDEIIDNGEVSSNFVSVSGGNETANYYLGYTNYKEKGILIGTQYERNNINSRNEFKLLDNRLKISQSTNIAIVNNTPKPNSAFTNAYKQSPLVPVQFPNMRWGAPLRDPNTGLIDINGSDRFNNVANPVAQLFYTNQQEKDFILFGSIAAEYKITKDLKVNSSFGATYNNAKGFTFSPSSDIFLAQNPTSFMSDYEATFGSNQVIYNTLNKRQSSSYIWNWDNYITYSKEFGKHNFSAVAGMSRTTKNNFESLSGTRFNVPAQSNYWSLNLSSYNGDATPGSVVNNYISTPQISIAYFARVEYDYNSKYLFSVTARREGTSVFQKSKQWGLFPAVSAGWVISNEDFMDNIPTISYLKFRTGYGEVGNSNTGNAVNNIVFNQGANASFGDGVIFPGSFVPYQVDSNLTWETMREFDFGLDFTILDNKLSGSIEYYNRTSSDIILPVTLPSVLSPGAVFVNTGEVSNIGQEISLKWSDKINDKLNYFVSMNFSNNQNTLKNVENAFFTNFIGGGLNNGAYTKQVLVGEALGTFYVFEVTGFDSDGEFTYSENRVAAGSYIPTYTYGLSFGANYNHFDFSVDTYGVGGNKVYNGKKAQRFGGENIEVAVLENFWTPSTPNAANPKPNNEVPVASTYFIEDGSFFRINNITAGYTFEKLFNKVDNVRIYATALNPFLFTKYSGYSPELSGNDNANPLGSAGIELDAYPTNRTFILGLNVSF